MWVATQGSNTERIVHVMSIILHLGVLLLNNGCKEHNMQTMNVLILQVP